jgi:hypothetical protein
VIVPGFTVSFQEKAGTAYSGFTASGRLEFGTSSSKRAASAGGVPISAGVGRISSSGFASTAGGKCSRYRVVPIAV